MFECIVVEYFCYFDVLSAAGERRRALGLERRFLGGQQETVKTLDSAPRRHFLATCPTVASCPKFLFAPFDPFTGHFFLNVACELSANFEVFWLIYFSIWRETIWQHGGSDGNARDESNELVQGRAAPGLWWLSRKELNFLFRPATFPKFVQCKLRGTFP